MKLHRLALLFGLFGILLTFQSGCRVLKQSPAAGCPDSLVNEWRYPPSHLTTSLDPSEADQVIKEDFDISSIQELIEDPVMGLSGLRWMELKSTYFEKKESELWRLDSPPAALGAKGVVLIQDCEMTQVYITLQS